MQAGAPCRLASVTRLRLTRVQVCSGKPCVGGWGTWSTDRTLSRTGRRAVFGLFWFREVGSVTHVQCE